MKKKRTAAVAGILSLVMLTACGTDKNAEKEKVLIAVEAQTMVRENMEQYITVSSVAKAENEISVLPKVSGSIKKVNVDLGQEVKAGDILLEIDDKDLRLQVSQAQAALSAAQANYDLNVEGNLPSQTEQMKTAVKNYEIQYAELAKNLEDMSKLYEAGAVSKQELDTLRMNVDTVKLQLDAAKKNLELAQGNISAGTQAVAEANVAQAGIGVQAAQNQLNNTKVRAEIDGVINSRNVSQGQIVSPQIPVMTIAKMDKIKFAFQVSEKEVSTLQKGSKAYVTVDAVSKEAFEANVTFVSHAADSKTMLYPVEVHMDNPNGLIKPGMFATVKVVLAQKRDVFSVPLNTVIHKDDKTFVYVVDDLGVAHKTEVAIGIQNDKKIEITNGVTEGMKVVIKGQDFIADESAVNIVEGK